MGAFYRRLADDNLTPANTQLVDRVLHTAFARAVSDELIPRNPVDAARPTCTYRATDKATYSLDQIIQLLNAAREHRLYSLVAVAATTSMRQGELFGLKWSSIDFEAGRIKVNNSLANIGGRRYDKDTKTHRSRRSIEVPELTLTVLRKRREEAVAEGLADCEYVWPSKSGKPLDRNRFRERFWKPLLKRAGLPGIPFKNVRHTGASLLLELGTNPKVVQELLGHTSFRVTMDSYGHVLPGAHRRAVKDLAEMIQIPAGLRVPGSATSTLLDA
jgi:integrase